MAAGRRVEGRAVAAGLAAALAGMVAGGEASAQALSGPEIRRLVSGRSASWVNASGYTGTITYLPNGVIQAKANVFGTSMNVGGTWSVRGDRFCRAMNMGPSGTSCQQVVRAGGGTYRFLNEDGSLATTTTFR
jgi:hypothetical protein